MAKSLSSRGASVVLAARSENKLNRIQNEIESDGGRVIAVPTDITDRNACKTLVDKTAVTFGGVDGIILNAGVSMWANFEDISDPSFFQKLMDVNYMGAVNCVHASLPVLIKSKGVIVSITTAQALMGFPAHAGYAASKHALRGFTETLEIESDGKVKFMDAYLGWIKGTDLRANAFGADGEKLGASKHTHGSHAIELDDCVNSIIKGMAAGKRRVYTPRKLRMIPILNIFARGWLQRKVSKAVKDHNK